MNSIQLSANSEKVQLQLLQKKGNTMADDNFFYGSITAMLIAYKLTEARAVTIVIKPQGRSRKQNLRMIKRSTWPQLGHAFNSTETFGG